ncbi:hypothetical protein WK78_26550 [Burkholderia cepacia]|nr:hypothetical protein WK78_26550 [Burkholderia cepacia]
MLLIPLIVGMGSKVIPDDPWGRWTILRICERFDQLNIVRKNANVSTAKLIIMSHKGMLAALLKMIVRDFFFSLLD